ncbi:GAF domain-containing protein [Paenibacillus anseongense]|uniref:GAF domain-containing protein n=1 Tax=Paenibacillus anseongense TaxID=2682845 RepID=UPI002DBB62F8|nr:GAF domain-containing protein [Paenibacillus anseongense]MEC0268195.1 GAF domain-containing protein [Paenibacillus anseongense]
MEVERISFGFIKIGSGKMAAGQVNIMDDLTRLRDMTSSDFIALAPFVDQPARRRWMYILGNKNDRCQQMVIKMGEGLAGTALRLGRWVKFDAANPRAVQERRECPVMLAEQLQTAAAFPLITSPSTGMKGLLFIGRRTDRGYEENEIKAILANLERLATYIEGPWKATSK